MFDFKIIFYSKNYSGVFGALKIAQKTAEMVEAADFVYFGFLSSAVSERAVLSAVVFEYCGV